MRGDFRRKAGRVLSRKAVRGHMASAPSAGVAAGAGRNPASAGCYGEGGSESVRFSVYEPN